MQDPKLLTDVSDRWLREGGKLPESGLQLLAPFSMMVANASMSGKLTATVEEEIASSSDSWATAALVSQGGKFSEAFLLAAYRKGVVDQIALESRAQALGAGNGESEFQLTGPDGKGGLRADTKVIVLEALARNKEAAAAALSQSFHPPVEVWDETKSGLVSVSSPVELLYGYGHFSDNEAAFGQAFVQGEGYEHDHDPAVGATMTLRLIDQVVNHGRGDMTPVQISLAGTVADHYMDSLHQSAYAGVVSLDYDPNGDGVPGGVEGGTLDLSQPETQGLLSTLSADETSRHVLMKGVVTYQAETIRKGFAGELQPRWPKEIGAFDGKLISANAANNVHDVEAAAARQAAITQALGTVLGIAHVPGADVVAQGVVGAASGTAGHTATAVNEVFRQQIANQLSATITVGYLHAHPAALASLPNYIKKLETEGLAFQPTSFVDPAGHVVPWDKMTLPQQRTFELWSDDHPGDGEAVAKTATDWMGKRIEDQTSN